MQNIHFAITLASVQQGPSPPQISWTIGRASFAHFQLDSISVMRQAQFQETLLLIPTSYVDKKKTNRFAVLFRAFWVTFHVLVCNIFFSKINFSNAYALVYCLPVQRSEFGTLLKLLLERRFGLLGVWVDVFQRNASKNWQKWAVSGPFQATKMMAVSIMGEHCCCESYVSGQIYFDECEHFDAGRRKICKLSDSSHWCQFLTPKGFCPVFPPRLPLLSVVFNQIRTLRITLEPISQLM